MLLFDGVTFLCSIEGGVEQPECLVKLTPPLCAAAQYNTLLLLGLPDAKTDLYRRI